jgi:flagellar assembly protein FliH
VRGAFELPTLTPRPVVVPPAPAAAVPAPAVPDPVELAEAQADAIRARAHEEGFAAGLELARAELAPAVEALAAAAAGFEGLRGEVADAVERGAVDLALRIAEQALGAAVEAQPERVVDVVRGALRRLATRERVVVLVNPADLDAVRDASGELIARLGGIESLDVQAERRVTRGGAVVRTTEGEVDATLETKLERANEILRRELADG